MTDPRIEEIARRYTRAAETYDEVWSPIIRPMSAPLFDALELTGAPLVVEVGCGTGVLTDDLRAVAPDATLIGADLAEGMVRKATSLGRANGVVANAMQLPFANACVDAAYTVFVLQLVPDPFAAIAEMGRILRAGGTGASATWGGHTDSRVEDVFEELMNSAGAPELPPTFDAWDLLGSEDKVASAWEKAGRPVRRIWTRHIDFRWTADSLIDTMTRYGRSKTRYESLAPDVQARFIEEFRARAAALSDDEMTWRPSIVFAIA